MAKGKNYLTAEEAVTLTDLAARTKIALANIAEVARDVGGDPTQSADYLNLQQINMAALTITTCNEGRFTHNLNFTEKRK